MSNNSQQNKKEGEVKIRRARCDSLCIFEITENELETLEKGSPSSIYLNFSIFLLSLAISFTITLLTVKAESVLFIIFLCITIIGWILGFLLLFLWLRQRSFIKNVIKKIKDRLPPEPSPPSELSTSGKEINNQEPKK